MTVESTGGILHGVWTSDGVITSSDRRLKKNIRELTGEVEKREALAAGLAATASGDPDKERSAVHWLLRQLRPVSYQFKHGVDSKNIRFGFIADEMQHIFPQVVRTLPNRTKSIDMNPEETAPSENATKEEPKEKDTSDLKAIVYPDLIAVLTSVVKDFGAQLQGMQDRMRVAELELARLDREDPMV